MGAWIIGHNSPGCLPDNPDALFAVETREDACRAFRDYVLDYADVDDEQDVMSIDGLRDTMCSPGCHQGSHAEDCEWYDQFANSPDIGTMTAHAGAALKDSPPESHAGDHDTMLETHDYRTVVFFMMYADDVTADEYNGED